MHEVRMPAGGDSVYNAADSQWIYSYASLSPKISYLLSEKLVYGRNITSKISPA